MLGKKVEEDDKTILPSEDLAGRPAQITAAKSDRVNSNPISSRSLDE
jgi:hypothetical protein